MSRDIADKFVFGNAVRRDWVELRDQPYVPSLSILRDRMALDPQLLTPVSGVSLKRPAFGVRNQRGTHRCVGYALAALIDIQRNLQWLHEQRPPNTRLRTDIVSADMLYHMAYFHDRYPNSDDRPGAEGIRSLRSVIKGFYHHGACLDWPSPGEPADAGRWQSTCFLPNSPDNQNPYPTVAQAKKAREIGLGAYFRVSPILNHFHAALNEAGAILVSAKVHDGWRMVVPEQGGRISWNSQFQFCGCHAFVITGYDEHGFHVLNSYGEGWGGYAGQAGIALWTYEDWAQNLIDAWVLRLGVPAPKAFDLSIGNQGATASWGLVQAGSTPCFELVGHYLNLDDGFHVRGGAYPSIEDGWDTTLTYLRRTINAPKEDACPYRGVLVWIPGSLEGIKSAFDAAATRKGRIKDLGLYPYSLFWCNSFLDGTLDVFDFIFDQCSAQTGTESEHLDNLIERRARGLGRAFWREVLANARRAVRGPVENSIRAGILGRFLGDLIELRAQTGCEIHIVAEGAGAQVVHEMLAVLAEDAFKIRKYRQFDEHDPAKIFDSLHLLHPAICVPRANQHIARCFGAMNGKDGLPHPTDPNLIQAKSLRTRARIYVPSPDLEQALHYGGYGKSQMQLIARAFAERSVEIPPEGKSDLRRGKYRDFLGTANIVSNREFTARDAVFQLQGLRAQTHPNARISQSALEQDPTIFDFIFNSLSSGLKPKISIT